MKKKNHADRFLAIVTDAKTRIKEIDMVGLKELMDSDNPPHVLDVREAVEWEMSAIPGAVHISKGLLEAKIETTIPDADAHIVLYCGGGFRSALAADNLQKMGYTNVWSLDGGYRAYLQSL